MSIMNSFINDVFEKICMESAKLVNNNKKHTLSSLNTQYLKEQKQLPNTVQAQEFDNCDFYLEFPII